MYLLVSGPAAESARLPEGCSGGPHRGDTQLNSSREAHGIWHHAGCRATRGAQAEAGMRLYDDDVDTLLLYQDKFSTFNRFGATNLQC